MSQNCECVQKESVSVPVRGINLKVNTSQLEGIVPDFRVGVETLYPGRREGKQIYAQVIDFGALPNATTKAVSHNIADVEWITVAGDVSYVDGNNGNTYPVCLSHSSAEFSWYCLVSDTQVTMAAGADRSAYDGYICLLYTKTIDPVIG